jgi:hypothetical protein
VSNDFNSDETKKMVQMVQSYYHPAKLMKLEKPGHYPDLGKTTLFVCNSSVCSQPLSYSENSKKEVDDFIRKLK